MVEFNREEEKCGSMVNTSDSSVDKVEYEAKKLCESLEVTVDD